MPNHATHWTASERAFAHCFAAGDRERWTEREAVGTRWEEADMTNLPVYVTTSGIIFGFLFAGFWWVLNRELKFDESKRHFKLSFIVLLIAMGLLALFGIVRPLYLLAAAEPVLKTSFKGIVAALIGVFGYMFAELGHYSVFQRAKYITVTEWLFSALAVAAIVVFALLFRF